MQYVQFGNVKLSRLILGSNPFSGFSHQGTERDSAMRHYYTTARIKETLRAAEALGINTVLGRTDHHVIRVLMEYWDEGGKIQWFGQTCPEVGSHDACIDRAAQNGAKACHLHGGVMDHQVAQGKLDDLAPAIERIRRCGMLAGIAGHNPQVFEWAEANLDVDYYMCSYYNSAHRDTRAEHVSGTAEWFLEEDRQAMTALIRRLSRPVIHYKILAAGRNDPAVAVRFAAQHMRATDAVCIGVFPKDNPNMLRDDARLLDECLAVR